ncbi:hypothetical protein IE81DRAFT_117485 [Ceraceosorus guamensis]|uniref:Uncharacterized protein n=1 Tax=Ceraceosorus guamensis TaxID=1522189 RepID=A0A316VYC3_9BASI|nr:hypothetical protein IE81DRAFT_117485 [Ceraceosorus guamensis]PWN42657.1 hypothetical protein IE81DRAFT_117485 [Ceraceosorus guamensis]
MRGEPLKPQSAGLARLRFSGRTERGISPRCATATYLTVATLTTKTTTRVSTDHMYVMCAYIYIHTVERQSRCKSMHTAADVRESPDS